MSALRLSPFQHVISLAGAIAITASLFSAAAAVAQPAASPAYRAELANPPSAGRLAAANLVWRCEGASCTAPRGTSRPAIVCARLAREAGPLNSFSAMGEAFDAAALARCNSSVR